MTPTQLE